MKTLLITALLSMSIITNTLAQKIDFSINLANDGRVHTNNSSVIDKDGNIFVAGGTRDGLKVTNDAFQTEYNGDSGGRTGGDIYLMKLSPEGELIYSTYIGGTQNEFYCNQIAMDEDGNVYVGFTTDSKDLPVSDNAYQKSKKGVEDDNDHYIIKFSNDCEYIASTYFGGSGSDHWTRLAVNNNILYLVGGTKSEDFPTTAGVIQDKYNIWGGTDSDKQWMEKDITITALSLNLDKVLHSTYLGGNNYEAVSSFSFDKNGRVILAGSTKSDDFPTSELCYDNSYNGDYDGFLTIINPSFTEIEYSTFIGKDTTDNIQSIAPLDANNIVIVGYTKSLDFPITSDALYGKYIGGSSDGFILKLNVKTNELVYSSYLGSTGGDQINELEITDKQKIILVGRTGSKDFPVSENALQQSNNGGAELVILKLEKSLKNIEYSSYIGGSKHEYFPNTEYTSDNKLVVTFTSTSSDFPVSIKYAEKDSTNLNVLVKIDLNNK
ncbi:MAG: SBBP repeat-containing protein [Bacteroidales bacterium]|nr:SBBP repeat-containing protein [Bacteroidales bacterium]